jgi:hypothetical protein
VSGRLIPDRVQGFIFAHLDSVGLLEVLLLLHSTPGKVWNSQSIVSELRANMNAVEHSIGKLKDLGFVHEEPAGHYLYRPADSELAAIVDELSEAYRVRRHRILELIFSPLKRARDFADAFRVAKDKKEENDG